MLNESKCLELIQRQKETGLNITDFCSNEGIAKSTFYYWRKKLGKESGKRFIPLLVNSSRASLAGQSKIPLREQNEQHPSVEDYILELVYPNGTSLRIKNDLDLSHLRALVNLLD
jgi:transposase-like protein